MFVPWFGCAPTPITTLTMAITSGQFWYNHARFPYSPVLPTHTYEVELRRVGGSEPFVPRWHWDYHYGHANIPMSGEMTDALVPLWPLFLLTASAAAWLWYRDRRYDFGSCRHCGYDLSAMASGVCPECGAERAEKRAGAGSPRPR
jgi:hypothetical protein